METSFLTRQCEILCSIYNGMVYIHLFPRKTPNHVNTLQALIYTGSQHFASVHGLHTPWKIWIVPAPLHQTKLVWRKFCSFPMNDVVNILVLQKHNVLLIVRYLYTYSKTRRWLSKYQGALLGVTTEHSLISD